MMRKRMIKKLGTGLVMLALFTLPALAARVDVANELGFGALSESTVGAVLAYDGGTVQVTSRVYSLAGVLTYVYQVDILSGAGTDIEFFTLFSVMFDEVGLSFGTVGAPAAGIGDFSFGNNMSYSGTAGPGLDGTLIDGSGGGQWGSTQMIIYAQSRLLPANILYQVADGVASNSTTRGPLRQPSVPEPGTLALLGGGLLALGWLRRRS